MNRIRAIMYKEFLHILRDRRSLMIIFVLPVMMMGLFGYAVRLDIRHIPLFIIDFDQSQQSHDLIRAFENSGYFLIAGKQSEPLDSDTIFRHHIARSILTIPSHYEKSLVQGRPIPVQFLSDATDSNTATIAGQYAEQIVLIFTSVFYKEWMVMPDLRSIILYNPELESTHFIVPGLVAVLFMMICALMTSVTIAREKETGTLEQMLVSPVRVREIIIGKVFPYIALASILGVIVLASSMIWFKVPFRGSGLLLAGVSLVYIFCSLSIGIFISTRVKTMQVAMMLALIITMLPSVMLSGFMFPIASMPKAIQIITHIVPARYYLILIRSIMLKGSDLMALRVQLIALSILTAVFLTVSIKRFKASLE